MIKKKTVFVLGAGANVPYGFSTGERLLVKARSMTLDEMIRLTDGQLHPSELRPLGAALADNFLPSIDALLERRDDLRRAGKKLMVALLLAEEAAALNATWSAEQDWMSLVFARMAAEADTAEEFSRNPVSFITFNYDRFLEHRLIRGLIARYKITPEKAWNAIQGFEFVHLYGSLGELAEQKNPQETSWPIPFGAPKHERVSYLGIALQSAEHSVQTVHDPSAGQRFAAAHSLLHGGVEQVFFFGFAFGRENVDRLQTQRILVSTRVYCTTYGMTSAEVQDSVEPAFPNHAKIPGRLVTQDATIKQFLREQIGVFR